MKKILIALGFTFAAMSAQSAVVVSNNLSLDYNEAAVGFTATNDITADTRGYTGTLSATKPTAFTVTYLGKEAGNTNFFIKSGGFFFDTSTAVAGESMVFNIDSGVIEFGFTGTGGETAMNGVVGSENIYYLLDNSSTGSFNIGFNDGGSPDIDADDLVVSVNAVPVPAALPLMASALGAFGIARRRNKAKVA